MLRIVVVTDDRGPTTAIPDPRRRVPGRGAWLHPDIACLEFAVRRRAFSRAFRQRVDGTDAVRAWLEDEPSSNQQEPTNRTHHSRERV
nr:YlxR family protein [Janibacter cremeus]